MIYTKIQKCFLSLMLFSYFCINAIELEMAAKINIIKNLYTIQASTINILEVMKQHNLPDVASSTKDGTLDYFTDTLITLLGDNSKNLEKGLFSLPYGIYDKKEAELKTDFIFYWQKILDFANFFSKTSIQDESKKKLIRNDGKIIFKALTEIKNTLSQNGNYAIPNFLSKAIEYFNIL